MVLFSARGRRKRVLKMVGFFSAAVAAPALGEGGGLGSFPSRENACT